MEKKSRKQILLFLFFLLLSLLLILFDNLGVLRPIRGRVEKLIIPIESLIYQTKQKVTPGETDKDKEKELAVAQSALLSCQEENQAMRRLLGALLPPSWKFLPAKVVGSPDGLLINIGPNSKVKPGMAVVFENIFVGRISWVGENLAKVILPSQPESKIPVLVRNPNEIGVKARGLLKGEGGKLVLDQVLQEETIAVGDLVLTSGEVGYPPDLVIGKIVKVQKQEAELFQQAIIESLLDYKKLTTIFVITNH